MAFLPAGGVQEGTPPENGEGKGGSKGGRGMATRWAEQGGSVGRERAWAAAWEGRGRSPGGGVIFQIKSNHINKKIFFGQRKID